MRKFELDKRLKLYPMGNCILVFAINGYMEKGIAENLDIYINTVKTHKRNFLKKLDAANVSEAQIIGPIHKII